MKTRDNTHSLKGKEPQKKLQKKHLPIAKDYYNYKIISHDYNATKERAEYNGKVLCSSQVVYTKNLF